MDIDKISQHIDIFINISICYNENREKQIEKVARGQLALLSK
jgi:hypothetical protein